ncbi:hypothetical protein ABDK56_01425 [Sphingomonas sp. ASV193]|uniref:hypothetical protein n=1 Tax=Sphingomonas sp. ASV193 TaxID=3144405 RepID=UPI0032E886B1
MNPFEFVIAIVAITTIGGIIRTKQMAKYGLRPRDGGRWGGGPLGGFPPFGMMGRRFRDDPDDYERADDSAEARALRDEVKQLKERIQTLERITVEKENSLAREIDSLRDR